MPEGVEQSHDLPTNAGDVTTVGADAAEPAARDLGINQRIGGYRLRRIIASGGMGIVYEATQERPRRTVALKVMKRGIASRSALRRFEYESQILARLRHPGIAQVFESGTHQSSPAGLASGQDGAETVPYFVMEYVPNARPITQYAQVHQLGMRERLELFAKVCDAVHHGHQKGIIHRDLKPANILIDPSGQPKVIDFGVARATDSDLAVTTLQTDVGQLIGTLQYMSPEQCDADPHDLDVRSDVYSLGVVLYELLTTELPYDVTTVQVFEAARVVRETPARRLSSINPALRGDVETIVLKALEKDRERRYQSAGSLAQDIERYLNNEPITARPASLTYQLRMFARRNRVAVSAIAAVVLALVVGIIGTTWGFVRANASRIDAEHQAARATQTSSFLREMLAMPNPYVYPGGPQVTVVDLLEEAVDKLDTVFADDPQSEAEIRFTIGVTFRNVGRYAEAEEQLERALTLQRRILGAEHRDTLQTQANLGGLYSDQIRYEEALRELRRTLDAQMRVLGQRDPLTISTMNSLGWVLFLVGQSDEAEKVFERALALRREILGEDDPQTLKTMTNLAVARIDLGKLDESEDLARTSAEKTASVLGREHPDAIYTTHVRAWWLWNNGQHEEAYAIYEEVVPVARATFGDAHPYTLYWINNTGELLTTLGRFDEAEQLLLESHAASRAVFGDEDDRTAHVADLLRALYEQWDKPELAARYLRSTSDKGD